MSEPWSADGSTWELELDWPEAGEVFLLLDGVRVKELARCLYEWSEGDLDADLLYAGTPWAEVAEVSPWLVRLQGPGDPVLERFLRQGAEAEWGYLILGSCDLLDVADHLRDLIQVRHPAGLPMLLRLADPAVISSLFTDGSSPEQVPWGPIERLIMPDAVQEAWHRHAPLEKEATGRPRSAVDYRLSESQLARLEECDRRRDIRQLMTFVDRHCDGWLMAADRPQRHAQLAVIVQEACELGLTTPREWALLCTLMQRLGITSWQQGEGLDAWTDLLGDPGQGKGMARLEAALAAAPTSSRTDVTT
ncbi:DUF4123 domain-containing protein [Halomonas koreensis]|uniref:DUF4123 domain-containing protein n=1 Tax=Halomonas koreensis TaxID=245385 RepID=A0ABU1G714_9GAMM|nr:DUF4123 domain-containing protein [Halomonas koreensis]MDR5868712.1 DUF4123 domain-containing protein [Halomonas koreensis]